MARKSMGAIAASNEWEVENDLRTMIECEKIEKDPKRLKAVKELAKKKMLEVAKVASGETE